MRNAAASTDQIARENISYGRGVLSQPEFGFEFVFSALLGDLVSSCSKRKSDRDEIRGAQGHIGSSNPARSSSQFSQRRAKRQFRNCRTLSKHNAPWRSCPDFGASACNCPRPSAPGSRQPI